jgi:preprotein translocase subunit YajC
MTTRDAKNWLQNWWPILMVVGGGLVAWGGLQARVSAVEQTTVSLKTDHDVLVKVSTQQDAMQKQLDRMEQKLPGGAPGGVR